MSQLDDGRLNLRELFLTGADEPDRISPTVRGEIDEQPALYDVQEIRGIASGDFMDWQERREPVCTAKAPSCRHMLSREATCAGCQ